MPAQVGAVIRRVRQILQDPDGIRWDDTELLDWFNDGRREAAVLDPREFAKRLPVALQYGTLQKLPAEAYRLLRVERNNAAGSTRSTIYPVDLRVLAAVHSGWDNPDVYPYDRDVINYAVDPDEPDTFHVFPGNDGTGQVEAIVAVLPPDATTLTDPLGVRDLLINAMADYVLYRAFSKDADYSGNGERAASHYAMFASALGAKSTSESRQ